MPTVQTNHPPLWMSSVLLMAIACAGLPTLAARAQSAEHNGLELICPLVEQERQRELEDYQLEHELVENEYQARRKVFDMVEALWAARSVEKELYLDYKRLRDRTKARVAKVSAQIAQQQGIVEQYQLACGQERGESIVEDIDTRMKLLDEQYHRIDCELLLRDAEIAAVDLEYDAAVFESTRVLAESDIKTRFDLVIEEYDLSQSKARVDGFRRRARSCKARLSATGEAALPRARQADITKSVTVQMSPREWDAESTASGRSTRPYAGDLRLRPERPPVRRWSPRPAPRRGAAAGNGHCQARCPEAPKPQSYGRGGRSHGRRATRGGADVMQAGPPGRRDTDRVD